MINSYIKKMALWLIMVYLIRTWRKCLFIYFFAYIQTLTLASLALLSVCSKHIYLKGTSIYYTCLNLALFKNCHACIHLIVPKGNLEWPFNLKCMFFFECGRNPEYSERSLACTGKPATCHHVALADYTYCKIYSFISLIYDIKSYALSFLYIIYF